MYDDQCPPNLLVLLHTLRNQRTSNLSQMYEGLLQLRKLIVEPFRHGHLWFGRIGSGRFFWLGVRIRRACPAGFF